MSLLNRISFLTLFAALFVQTNAFAAEATDKPKSDKKPTAVAGSRVPTNIAGKYTFGAGARDHVTIKALKNGEYSAEIFSTFNVNSGGSGGTFKVVNGYGVISPKGCNRCEFLLAFKGPKVMVMQEGDNEALCGMGNGVSASRVYSRGGHKNEPNLTGTIWSQGPVKYLNAEGKVVLGPYAGGETFSEGLAAVKGRSKKWGFIDPTGKLIIPYRYDRAEVFKHGMATAGIKDNWGYIDKSGKWVVKPTYWKVGEFGNEGIANVTVDSSGKSFYINAKGAHIGKDDYYDREDFSDGMGVISDGNKHGAIDATGKEVIPPTYHDLGHFQEGLAFFQEGSDDKYGYVDKTGTVKIQPTFDEAGPFSDGLARVRIEDRWGYIDKSGKVVIKPEFVTAPGDFSEGLSIARPAKSPCWQIIDKTGKKIGDMPFGYRISLAETKFRSGVVLCKFVQWEGLGGSDRYWPIDKTGKILPGFVPSTAPPVGMYNFSDGLIVTRNTEI